MTQSADSERRKFPHIGLFLALTAVLSSVFYGFIIVTGRVGGAHGAYATGLMWCPGIAALLTCRLTGVGIQTLGWQWGAWRWQWLAWAIPFGYAGAAYGAVWIGGFGSFPDPEFLTWARKSLGWTRAADWVVVSGYALLIATTGMAVAAAQALGEEIGWRGFLAPRLHQRFGFATGAMLTGAIWAAWHSPILLFADYNGGTPWGFGVPCFTAMVIGMSVVMQWLRLASGSLWTAVLFHASHNVFVQSVFTPVTGSRGKLTAFAVGEFGLAVPAATIFVALLIFVCRAYNHAGRS